MGSEASRTRTSGSRSPPSAASSSRSSGSRAQVARPDRGRPRRARPARPRGQALRGKTSRAARSRSRTSACTASSGSPRSSTRRRPRSSPSARSTSAPVAENGELVVRPMMTMTLTCDHRAVDGATRGRVPARAEDASSKSRGSRCDPGLVPGARPRRGARLLHRQARLHGDLRATTTGRSSSGRHADRAGRRRAEEDGPGREHRRRRRQGRGRPAARREVEIGTVLELHDEVRIVDVFDPDGNRLQLVQQLRP